VVHLDGQLRAIITDPAFKAGNYTEQPVHGIETTGSVWLAWLYSQEWWKRELWKKTDPAAATMTLAKFTETQSKEFFAGIGREHPHRADADLAGPRRGTTPGFDGKHGEVPAFHLRPGALHALRDRPLLSAGRRTPG